MLSNFTVAGSIVVIAALANVLFMLYMLIFYIREFGKK